MKIGGWQATDEGDQELDPLTMRITGGTDHMLRTYVDELTGVALGVLVLFGPAEPVIPHTPEACYPASGFSLDDDIADREVRTETGATARFRSAVYAKTLGRVTLREEVYYSFRLDGRWTPDPGAGRKFPRRNPSVIKVQVQRRFGLGELRDRNDPIEQFLAVLLPEIERKINAAKPARPPSTSDARPTDPGLPVVDPSDRREPSADVRPVHLAEDEEQGLARHREDPDQANHKNERE